MSSQQANAGWMMKGAVLDNRSTSVEQRVRCSNKWLLLLFSILWLADSGLTLWAVNNGYVEVWNPWVIMLIGHTWAFVAVKLLTLAMVIGIVRWASNNLPHVIFVALIVFNVLIGTVTAANIITIVRF